MSRTLSLYNTATRTKEPFAAPDNEVHMYACGPTVYNYAHIGNLRTYVFEDVLRRTLDSLGYRVKHVVNITDVGHLISDEDTGEDKMEKGARREGKTVWDIAAFYTARFMDNIAALNVKQPLVWCKATDHIGEMIAMVKTLEEKGFTYRTSDGIYFDTTRFGAYCDFAKLDSDSLRAGSRVAMGEKKHPTDFALWKFSPDGVERQMEWESPWGTGFPGWHIECSAMSLKYLRQPLDIHCGGIDHIRIHHSNEIAQVEAATGKKFCRFWLHGEFLVVDKGKMAKSGDNFVTLDTVREKGLSPLAYRFFCFSAHYRSPLTFSWDGLESAGQGLKNLRKAVLGATSGADGGTVDPANVESLVAPFWEAVCDDLNMPKALAAVWEIIHNRAARSCDIKRAIEILDTVLGLNLFENEPSPTQVFESETGGVRVRIIAGRELEQALCEKIVELAVQRKNARAGRDFVRADSLRESLAALGVMVMDLKDGTTECSLGQQ